MLAVCILACAARCARADDLAFTRLCHGDDAAYGAKGGGAAPAAAVARDPDELRRVWAEYVTGPSAGAKAAPAVAWERNFALGVFLGPRPAPAAPPAFLEVVIQDGVLEVQLEEHPPPPVPGPRVSPSPYRMVACDALGVRTAEIRGIRIVGPDRRLVAECPVPPLPAPPSFASPVPPRVVGIPFSRLCGGGDAVYGAKKTTAAPEVALARDQDELRRVWAEDVTGAYRDTEGMPAVGWDRDFVVAVFLGARPAPAATPAVRSVAVRGKVLEVVLEAYAPPAGPVAERPASPYAMVRCGRAGVAVEGILMLRLLGPDGGVIVERPAWSHRMMDTGGYRAGKEGVR